MFVVRWLLFVARCAVVVVRCSGSGYSQASCSGLLLLLQGLEFGHDIGIDVVGDVFAVPNFGNDVVLLLGVGKVPVLLEVKDVVVTQSQLDVTLGLQLLGKLFAV